MVYIWQILSWTLLIVFAYGKALARQKLCDEVEILSFADFDFTVTERELVCDHGSSESPWSAIPVTQKRYFLSQFLRARGYYSPEFSFVKGVLNVQPGTKSRIRQVLMLENPIGLKVERYWQVYGQVLNSKALDKLERWILREYSRKGYPCADIQVTAYALEERVEVRVQIGEKSFFPSIKAVTIPAMTLGVEKRYLAFQEGQEFNVDLLELSSQRIEEAELVVNSHFHTSCPEKKASVVHIDHRVVAGQPRLVSFGLGFDTEEFAIGELSWKNTRFTPMASLLQAASRLSYRHQWVTFSFDWYYAPLVINHFIRSSLSYRHRYEALYRSQAFEAQVGPAWGFDRWASYFEVWLAASVRREETPWGGTSTRSTQGLALNIRLQVQSHDFEFYRANPRSGFGLNLEGSFANKAIASDISAHTWQGEATSLWNLFALEPPIWILGLRLKLSSTSLGAGTSFSEVPISMRYWLGGSQNVRGFPRLSIPLQGALATAYIGAEVRLSSIFPYGMQPIFFGDWGKAGDSLTQLARPSFVALGAGLHWSSPVGTLRGTLARGFVSPDTGKSARYRQRWQFYFSFGEQF